MHTLSSILVLLSCFSLAMSTPIKPQVRIGLGVEITHFNTPYQNTVYKMEKDLASTDGGFLYADGFAIYSIDANFSSASNRKLLGRNNGPYYQYEPIGKPENDDTPTPDQLYALAGFTQVDSTTILAVSTYRHCVLRLDRTTSKYRVVAGTCGSSGLADGPIGTARFSEPGDIIGDTDDTNIAYVCDKANNALRRVDLKTGDTVTLDVVGINSPTSMFWSLDKSGLFVANQHHVSKIVRDGETYRSIYVGGYDPDKDVDYFSRTLNTTIINYGFGVAEVEQGLLVVVDMGRQTLQIMDLERGVSKPACRGMLDEPQCDLEFPSSVLYDQGRLYMGDSGGIHSAPVLRNN